MFLMTDERRVTDETGDAGKHQNRRMRATMYRRQIASVVFALLVALAPLQAQRPLDEQRTIENIRTALLRLPYYGVFDFLAFTYERGTVTLSGYAYRASLKNDAVRAVKRVAGVDEVIDKIEQLSVSPHDESIRWATFYQIYYDNSLSRYAPGGGIVGIDHRLQMSRFPGMEPLGMYPIHIIVNRGRTLLAGVVDSEADRILAGVRAREVPGTFRIENALEVPDANKSGAR